MLRKSCSRRTQPSAAITSDAPPLKYGGSYVAVDEWNEATFDCAAVVKPVHAAYLINRGSRLYDRFAPERSLAELVNCYGAG